MFFVLRRVSRQLNRSVQRHGKSVSTSSFPKKAYQRLCEAATTNDEPNNNDTVMGPWIRPDDDEAPSGGYLELVRSKIIDTTPQTEMKNSYCPHMKKSLYQLDSFLLAARNLCTAEVPATDQGKETDKQETPSTYSPLGILEAWSLFCREENSKDLIPVDDLLSVNNTDHTNEIDNNPAKLGQYFASKENAKDVSTLCEIVGTYPCPSNSSLYHCDVKGCFNSTAAASW